jgi:hypothetical protein
MIALMISNCEKLRAPPPSIIDSKVRAISRGRKEFEPKLAIIRPCSDVILLDILIREFNKRFWWEQGGISERLCSTRVLAFPLALR